MASRTLCADDFSLMKILIAPDSFKGSLSATEVAACMADGLRAALPDTQFDFAPMADGGEGTLEILLGANHGRAYTSVVSNAFGFALKARYALLANQRTAVVELAEVCGLTTVPARQRDPLRTTSYGVGELMRAALASCRG